MVVFVLIIYSHLKVMEIYIHGYKGRFFCLSWVLELMPVAILFCILKR
jgi:hypothetical protein